MKHLATLLLGMLLPSAATAVSWPDTPLARTEALALLQTLNADLLSHPSATLTLERWCASHRLAATPTVVARRDRAAAKPLPEDLRRALGVDADTPVRYRRVQLACGDRVLSEADNWYLPGRLTASMNDALDHTDTPFGKVVAPLHFRRRTLSARLLWSPLPKGWEMGGLPAAGQRPLVLPHQVLQHRALLYDAANQPFSALVETYTDQVLGFRAAPVSTGLALRDDAVLHLPELVSTAYSEVRLAVSPDGDTELWGSVDRPGGPGGWDIWMIRRGPDGWSAPAPVTFDTSANEFDPAFGADGRTVWFFSNRAGGLGGDDIWSVPFDPASGRFGTPRNAGPAINSAGDEWAPAPTPDGDGLLFASDGRGGAGRHDLFLARRRDGAWQAAVPLPGQLNTAQDEFDASFLDAGRVLVYTRAADVERDPAGLWFAVRGAGGSYVQPQRLDARVNAAGGWAMGPATDPRRPGVLLFSGKRPELSRGRSDIYEIRFHPQP